MEGQGEWRGMNESECFRRGRCPQVKEPRDPRCLLKFMKYSLPSIVVSAGDAVEAKTVLGVALTKSSSNSEQS